MLTLEILKYARALVAAGWCQKVGRIAADGTPYPPLEEDAAQQCLTAALGIATIRLQPTIRAGLDAERIADRYLVEALPMTYSQLTAYVREWGDWTYALRHWNDERLRTQADVVALYDRAIASVEKSLRIQPLA